MKIKFLLVCIIIAAALTTGCSRIETPPVLRQTEPSTATAITSANAEDTVPQEPVYPQLPMLAVSVPIEKETVKAEDGTTVSTTVTQSISLTMPDPQVADKLILDFLNQTDVHATAQSVSDAALQAYAADPAHFTPYTTQITFDPVRLDPGVLSFFGSMVTYTGGPHGEVNGRSVSYDLTTGKPLSLYDILSEVAKPEDLASAVINALSSQQKAPTLYDGFEQTVNQRFGNTFRQDTDWYFSQNGLCFYFSPYEIAPYASGIVVAEIPYPDLVGILKDAYFPAERQDPAGNIQVIPFTEEKAEHFSQYTEVLLHKDGKKQLLCTDKTVYDLRLTQGTWSSDGTVYTPQHTVFAAFSLTPGDAVLITSESSETLPDFTLSYTSSEGTVTQRLP